MDNLFIIVVLLWTVTILLIVLFLKKYHVVDGICINKEKCNSAKQDDGCLYFEYQKNDGNGLRRCYGRVGSLIKMKEGKKCKLLVTKEYNENAILLSDVIKLLLCLLLVSVLLLIV